MGDSFLGYFVAAAAGFAIALVVYLLFRRGRGEGNMLAGGLSAVGARPALVPPRRKSTLALGRELAPEVEQLLRGGDKVAAVKLVRERTGLGLKESKDAVEVVEKLLKIL